MSLNFIINLQKGELYSLTLELRDPNINAIEFVLKDSGHDRWLVSPFLFKLTRLVNRAHYA